MNNKNDKTEYYSLKKIDSKKAIYNVIIGQRSNGKTYSVVEKIIKNYFKTGERGAYIRRLKEDLTFTNLSKLMNPHIELIKKLSKGRYNNVKYYRGEFYLVNRAENGDIIEQSETGIIKTYSLNAWESAKGADNGYFGIILFDEFLTRAFYLKDEFIIFTQVLSSIIRDRDGAIIYMIANTVNKYCPYFAEMGLTNIDKMTQGTIDVYRYGNSDLTVAVEYCADIGTSKKVAKYFAFNNPRLQMVTSGTWEIASYPHCPVDYDKDEILFHAFIQFNNKLIHGEIVRHYDNLYRMYHLFVFFYEQTKPKDIEKIEVLYTDKHDSNVLHCTGINQQPTKMHEMFIQLIKTHNDYYNTNETGEIVRNWKIQNGLLNVR